MYYIIVVINNQIKEFHAESKTLQPNVTIRVGDNVNQRAEKFIRSTHLGDADVY